MQWSAVLLLAFGCLQATITLSEKVTMKQSSSFHYSYQKIEVERVFWRYEKKVRTVAIGCTLDSGESLLFGQTYESTFFVLRCDKVNDTAVRLVPVRCLLDGKPLEKGESRPKGSFVYSCLQHDGKMDLEITGCIGDDKAVASIGEKFVRKSFMFICLKSGDSVMQKAVACLLDGQEVPVHRAVSFGKFWYKCSRVGRGGIQLDVMGCVTANGVQVDAGQRYRDGNYFYHCKEKDDGVSIVFAGCIAKELGMYKEFSFGESWYTRPVGSLSYRVQCSGNEKTARTEIIECIVNLDEGRRSISVGNSAKYGNDRMFTCLREADGTVVAKLITVEQYMRIYKSSSATKTTHLECIC
uniref:ZP domain-containing protein n=1 Tax=Trichuris muris TaxID=70415 RepID=A0A5S6QM56_TRIMR